VYFLRRVIEPRYVEDVSPGYVGQTSEFVWLDPELVSAESRTVRGIIRQALDDGSVDGAMSAVARYLGPFAIDFLYDEWSGRYRDGLHAAYLQLVETSLRTCINDGAFDRGIEIAQAAAEVDGDSDAIQLALVRLYRLAGAHAAAAEQYGRYAEVVKDLGLQPPPLDEIVGAIGRPAY
jgi:DNA-binding SARP family transcriptional activator